jgi:hypothetical integral membrane protein (TIGR02206 family)
VPLFGAVHCSLLVAIGLLAAVLVFLARRNPGRTRAPRLTLGIGIAVNELIWWTFRYSHEGFRFPNNLPLQLCDMTLWAAVLACLTLNKATVEFCYFAGIAGAGMALLTPDLWSPWPSYPAIYFFVAHGGIVIAAVVLVYGRISPLRKHAVWRAFGLLVAYAVLVGVFDKIFQTNYMYLCAKPKNASLLDMLGPWPVYLAGTASVTLALFFLLWLPTRKLPDA